MKGSSAMLNDEFTVFFGETYITMKVVESIPGKRIVWQVTDCNKHWLKNKKEWTGTEIVWEISGDTNSSKVLFTHKGLVPALECFDACENAWSDYLQNSLTNLVSEGTGEPEAKVS